MSVDTQFLAPGALEAKCTSQSPVLCGSSSGRLVLSRGQRSSQAPDGGVTKVGVLPGFPLLPGGQEPPLDDSRAGDADGPALGLDRPDAILSGWALALHDDPPAFS